MVRAEVIRKRLNKLEEYLVILFKLQRYNREDLCQMRNIMEVQSGFCNWRLSQ